MTFTQWVEHETGMNWEALSQHEHENGGNDKTLSVQFQRLMEEYEEYCLEQEIEPVHQL